MWFHVVLYGLAMSVIFTLTLCLVSYIDPQSFTKMYPPAIQKIAPPIPAESRKIEVTMLICLWTFMVLFSIISNYLSGVRGFGQLFLAGYIQFFMVDMGDFFFFFIFFREKMGRKLHLPGTEGSELYSRKNWLLKMAIPNHFGIWLIGICPLGALLNAGAVTLLRTLF
mgnify:FL=1